jgi:hypothetical protein
MPGPWQGPLNHRCSTDRDSGSTVGAGDAGVSPKSAHLSVSGLRVGTCLTSPRMGSLSRLGESRPASDGELR